MDPLALTIAEAVKLGGPCRSALYEDIRQGRLRAVKRGRSTRILVDDFKAYLASLTPVLPRDDAAHESAKVKPHDSDHPVAKDRERFHGRPAINPSTVEFEKGSDGASSSKIEGETAPRRHR